MLTNTWLTGTREISPQQKFQWDATAILRQALMNAYKTHSFYKAKYARDMNETNLALPPAFVCCLLQDMITKPN